MKHSQWSREYRTEVIRVAALIALFALFAVMAGFMCAGCGMPRGGPGSVDSAYAWLSPSGASVPVVFLPNPTPTNPTPSPVVHNLEGGGGLEFLTSFLPSPYNKIAGTAGAIGLAAYGEMQRRKSNRYRKTAKTIVSSVAATKVKEPAAAKSLTDTIKKKTRLDIDVSGTIEELRAEDAREHM